VKKSISWNRFLGSFNVYKFGLYSPVPTPFFRAEMVIFKTFKETRNLFQRTVSASLCSLAGRYGNPIPTRFLAPLDCKKFQHRLLYNVHLWKDDVVHLRYLIHVSETLTFPVLLSEPVFVTLLGSPGINSHPSLAELIPGLLKRLQIRAQSFLMTHIIFSS
jgi:hypothetical protein